MNKLYANYRLTHFNKGAGGYTPNYLGSQQFSDYEGLITIKDQEIPEKNYTKINANGIKNLTRFMTYELIDGVDVAEFEKSVTLIAGQNCIELFATVEEARQDVRDRTDLVEEEPGKFLIHGEYEDELEGGLIPAKYLTIN